MCYPVPKFATSLASKTSSPPNSSPNSNRQRWPGPHPERRSPGHFAWLIYIKTTSGSLPKRQTSTAFVGPDGAPAALLSRVPLRSAQSKEIQSGLQTLSYLSSPLLIQPTLFHLLVVFSTNTAGENTLYRGSTTIDPLAHQATMHSRHPNLIWFTLCFSLLQFPRPVTEPAKTQPLGLPNHKENICSPTKYTKPNNLW